MFNNGASLDANNDVQSSPERDPASDLSTQAWLLVHDALPEQQTETERFIESLLKADSTRAQELGETIARLLQSEDKDSLSHGHKLLALAQDPRTFDMAANMATGISDDRQRQRLINLATDRQTASAADRLLQMLDPDAGKDSNPYATVNLLNLLIGDGEQKQTGTKLLSMLNDPKQAVVAEQLLSNLLMGADDLRNALILLDDPKRKDLSADFRALLATANEFPMSALPDLVKRLSDTAPHGQSDGKELLRLLRSETTRDLATTILSQLHNAKEMHAMLELLTDERTRPAAQELLTMLSSPDSAPQARSILTLAASEHAGDRKECELILKNLTHADAGIRESTRLILQHVYNYNQRIPLFEHLNDPALSAGTQRLLRLYLSKQAALTDSVDKLIEALGSQGYQQRLVCKDMLRRLSGDTQEQSTAMTLIEKVPGIKLQQQMLRLLHTPEHAQAGQTLLGWLEGTAAERAAAIGLLSVEASEPSDFKAEQKQTFQHFVSMIGDEKQRDTVLTILRSTTNAAQLHGYFTILTTPEWRDTAAQLIEILRSGTTLQRTTVDQAMEMAIFRPIPNEDASTRAYREGSSRLLRMLGDPARREDGMTILNSLDSRYSSIQLAKLLDSPDYNKIGRKIVDLLRYPNKAEIAHFMLNKLREPEEMAKLMEIMESPQYQHLATQVPFMLGTFDGLVPLLAMLAHKRPAVAELGLAYLKRLNDPETQYETQALLRTGLPVQQLENMLKLQTDPLTKAAAQTLCDLTDNSSLNAIAVEHLFALTTMGSPQETKAFHRWIDRLQNPSERQMAINSIMSSYDLVALSQLADDPAVSRGVDVLCAVGALDRIDQRGPNRLRLGLELLTSPDDERRAAGMRILHLLQDRRTETMAKYILAGAQDTNQLADSMELAFPNLPTTPQQEDLATTLRELWSNPDRFTRRIPEMASILRVSQKPPHRAAAIALLNSIGSDESRQDLVALSREIFQESDYAGLARLMGDPNRQHARRVLAEIGRSGSTAEKRAVGDLIMYHGAPLERTTDDGRTYHQDCRKLLDLLEAKETTQFGQDLLKLVITAPSREAVTVISEMLETKEGTAALRKLVSMAAKPETRAQAMNIASGLPSPATVMTMLSFMETPGTSAAREYLLEMISSDQPGRRIAGSRAVDYMTNYPDHAKQMLSLVQNQDTRLVAEFLFDRVDSDYTATDFILEKLNTMQHPQAATILNKVIKARGYLNRDDLMGLHSLMTSCNPEARHRVEAIRLMLQAPRQEKAALNLIPRPGSGR